MKYLSAISILLFWLLLPNADFTSLSAQKIISQTSYGGSDIDYLGDVIRSTYKGWLIVSTSTSGISGDKTDKCFGGFDYWILKTNKKGKIQWQRTLGGDQEDEPLAIIETQDGGYLICGSSISGISGNKTIENIGQTDFWVIKLDKNGNVEWQKGYGRNNVDYLVAAMHYPGGGYLLAGYSWLEPTAQKGRYDYWLVLIDEKGEQKWEQSIGGNHDDILTDAIIDKNKNIVMTGYSLSGAIGDKTEPCLGNFDYWTVCLNKERKIVWQKTSGTDQDDRPEKLMQDINGIFHIGGSTPLNVAEQKLSNFWTVSLDQEGKFKRELKSGGDDGDFLIDIIELTANEFLYGGGSKSGKSGDKTMSSFGGIDAWIIKYGVDGKKKWDASYGGNNRDNLLNVLPYKGQCYTLFIESDSGKSGNLTNEGKGMEDIVMITIKDKKKNP